MTKYCIVEVCDRPVCAWGMCAAHYQRWKKHGDPGTSAIYPRGVDPEVHFWNATNTEGPIPPHRPDLGPCWVWTKCLNKCGYGSFGPRKESWLAHRWAYEHFVGRIPDGLELDHLCKNRACVRPAHMDPVTHAENVRRGNGGQHNSSKTHCKYNHPFDAENTVIDARGIRQCRICSLRRARKNNKLQRTRAKAKKESQLP